MIRNVQTNLGPKTEISNIPAKPPTAYYVRALALGVPLLSMFLKAGTRLSSRLKRP